MSISYMLLLLKYSYYTMHRHTLLAEYPLYMLIHCMPLYILSNIHCICINHLLYINKIDNLLLFLLVCIIHFQPVQFLAGTGILHSLYIDYIQLNYSYQVVFAGYNRRAYLLLGNAINHILHTNEYLLMYRYITGNKVYSKDKLRCFYSGSILIHISNNMQHLLRQRKCIKHEFNNSLSHIIYHSVQESKVIYIFHRYTEYLSLIYRFNSYILKAHIMFCQLRREMKIRVNIEDITIHY